MERSNNNTGFIQKQNKGFTIHLGDEYVGHLVINEDRISPQTIANLQKPAVMKMVLAEAELRKFVPKEERENRDTSGIDSIIAKATAEESVESAEPEQTGSPLDNLSARG